MHLAIRTLTQAICAVSIAVTLIVAFSGSVRTAFLSMMTRQIARVAPPTYAYAGDSLTEQCFRYSRLTSNPIATVRLAVGGSVLRTIVYQVAEAEKMGAHVLIINGGINDLLLDGAPAEQIAWQVEMLLERARSAKKVVFTLLPFTSDAALSERIDQANRAILPILEKFKVTAIDLNPVLSQARVRKPDMTTDGIHFTERACAIWRAAVKRELGLAGAQS